MQIRTTHAMHIFHATNRQTQQSNKPCSWSSQKMWLSTATTNVGAHPRPLAVQRLCFCLILVGVTYFSRMDFIPCWPFYCLFSHSVWIMAHHKYFGFCVESFEFYVVNLPFLPRHSNLPIIGFSDRFAIHPFKSDWSWGKFGKC